MALAFLAYLCECMSVARNVDDTEDIAMSYYGDNAVADIAGDTTPHQPMADVGNRASKKGSALHLLWS